MYNERSWQAKRNVDVCTRNLLHRDLRMVTCCDAAFRFMALKFGLIDTNVGRIYRWMHGISNQYHSGIKEPICGFQNYNVNQILTFGRCVKLREFLYTSAIVGPTPF